MCQKNDIGRIVNAEIIQQYFSPVNYSHRYQLNILYEIRYKDFLSLPPYLITTNNILSSLDFNQIIIDNLQGLS